MNDLLASLFLPPTLSVQNACTSDTIPSTVPTNRSWISGPASTTPLVTSLLTDLASSQRSLSNGDFSSAFSSEVSAATTLSKLCATDGVRVQGATTEGHPLVPLVCAITTRLRRLALLADAAAGDGRQDRLEAAARELNKFFQAAVTDRSPLASSRKWGALHITNQLLRIYFAMNNLRLCKNPIRAVTGPGMQALEDRWPREHRAVFAFFRGRLAMYEGDFVEAATELSLALEAAPTVNAQREALLYLVPIQMNLGKLPTRELLDLFGLTDLFWPFAQAIRTGNVALLRDALLRHESICIQRGIYLILEKLRLPATVTLLRTVCESDGTTKVPLALMARAMKLVKEDASMDRVECIVANLIYQGYVKGYISHTHRILVLSPKNPFPKVAS
mmetsp:Transcript_3753/g.12154  ORF Transcript_3753/g.12154 Transcript_3753/m.12154 type:complete len:390 (-) Transcript_3753:70-1239(-)|eukprot:CAMPEP_0170745742 /NCGR_PEP_ID=MMETSP0437-20130122/8449_1 /TAXON_ID=0 /ORGANISM="Sexangularia sp." /LENGTH=389 /DNA_ID=CAMNT_0011084469 /DNA_START=38 /DNA_END=1207 /DNA_ORIENTATION=-